MAKRKPAYRVIVLHHSHETGILFGTKAAAMKEAQKWLLNAYVRVRETTDYQDEMVNK